MQLLQSSVVEIHVTYSGNTHIQLLHSDKTLIIVFMDSRYNFSNSVLKIHKYNHLQWLWKDMKFWWSMWSHEWKKTSRPFWTWIIYHVSQLKAARVDIKTKYRCNLELLALAHLVEKVLDKIERRIPEQVTGRRDFFGKHRSWLVYRIRQLGFVNISCCRS